MLEDVVRDRHTVVGVQALAAGDEAGHEAQAAGPVVDDVAGNGQVVEADRLRGVGDVLAPLQVEREQRPGGVVGEDVAGDLRVAAGLGVAEFDPAPRGMPLIVPPPRKTLFRTVPVTPPGVIGPPFTRPKLMPIGSLRKMLFSIKPPDRACSPWLDALEKRLPRATSPVTVSVM